MTLIKKQLIAVALACLSLCAYAKESKNKNADMEPITLLVKVSLAQKIDPFYAETFEGDPLIEDWVYPDSLEFLFRLRGTKHLAKACNKAGEFFLISRAYPKNDGHLEYESFNYLPYGIFDAHLTLPFAKEITIPEGARFVYIGSLVYDIDPKTFQVKSVKILDEYEAAQAAANKLCGKEVELIRAPIKDLPAK